MADNEQRDTPVVLSRTAMTAVSSELQKNVAATESPLPFSPRALGKNESVTSTRAESGSVTSIATT